MAGALSGHLIDSYYTFNRSTGPFGMPFPQNQNQNQNPSFTIKQEPDVVVSGAMSFDRSMHGSHNNNSNNSFFSDQPSFTDMSEATESKIASLQAKLNQRLGPEYISTRPGPGGGPKLIYAEGWKVINLANEVFGFNGWSSSITSITTDYVDFNEETRRYNIGISAIIRVTLRDGVYHEDVGYGLIENSKSKGTAFDKCRKEAVTDGLKRTLRNFGNLLGNCLYDKSYTQEVVKIKVNPPKFDPEQLHRRPEFTEKPVNAPPVASTSSFTNTSAASTSKQPAQNPNPSRSTTPMNITPAPAKFQPVQNAPKPPPAQPTGLNTPITTPVHTTHHQQFTTNQGQKVSFVPASESPLARNTALPPQPLPVQVQERATASSSSVTLDDDDPYRISSEDEALYAMVDLGDEDSGRPIQQEDSVSYEDESYMTTGGDLDTSNSGMMAPPPPPPQNHRQTSSEAGKMSRHSAIAAALAESLKQDEPQPPRARVPLGQQPYTGNAGASTSTNRPSGSGASSSSTGKTLPSLPAPSFSGLASSTPKKGGFSFPSETTNPSRPQQQQHQQQAGSGIGLKRNADAMRPPSHNSNNNGYSRRPAQGMGLMEPGGGGGGDGGDPKRLRR